jgi:hypothetical protein
MRLRLSRLERWLTPKGTPRTPDRRQIELIHRYTNRALRIGWPFVQVKCLTRGVTLYYFLRRAGLEVTLCFGVGELNSRFAAHCWLLKDALPYSEPDDPYAIYTPIYTVPRTSAGSTSTITEHAPGR